MITTAEFVVRARIDDQTLAHWIAAGWLLPQRTPDPAFSEVDLARAQLIRELKEDFGVNDEGISLVLHLLDQIHGLRRNLQILVEEVRRNRRPITGEL
jgi:chaperone modulatory protein CbpM